MSYYSPSIEKLIEAFEKLPSIGNKTAARLAFYILDADEKETNEFIEAIQNAKKNLKYCSICYNITDTEPCPICANKNRDHSVICIVEKQISLIKFATLKYRWFNPDCFGHLEITTIN